MRTLTASTGSVVFYVGPEGDSNNGIVLTGEGTISIDSFVKNCPLKSDMRW